MFIAHEASISQRMGFSRQVRGIQQADMAKRLNVSPLSLGKYERDEVNRKDIGLLVKFADILHLNLNWLIKGTGEPFEVPLTTPERFVYARLSIGWTLDKASSTIRCDRALVTKMERDGPDDIKTAKRFASAYGVDLHFLVPEPTALQKSLMPARTKEMDGKGVSEVRQSHLFSIVPVMNSELKEKGDFHLALNALPPSAAPVSSLRIIVLEDEIEIRKYLALTLTDETVMQNDVTYLCRDSNSDPGQPVLIKPFLDNGTHRICYRDLYGKGERILAELPDGNIEIIGRYLSEVTYHLNAFSR